MPTWNLHQLRGHKKRAHQAVSDVIKVLEIDKQGRIHLSMKEVGVE